ncbi:helix-turn-helix domain-containing protein [Staphylococcus aureus]|uniref:helix-turn-helix domain-containing protein n=1 Tax=Staphylococcus aureus TaxID=1280 RepID=UPI0013A6BA94|nr:helix-turn-helix transcriptional regulator [Staphylococcus aureus]NDR22719.1 helix-turn-helix transcriptional regulator [Staphylococcus aureus]HDH6549527.1 helix-turn-helix transcriptional regulator [Staphylococcus aureus]HDZ8687490.1 helix-turn-helix transcriptional regulator [Staphylococcus aureus]HED8493892.1 helix-turn-helix transcriptional regulator [Staphylococcus aureus]
MKLGKKIKNHRLNKGMNMREYGEFIDNTSDSIVSRWERNVSIPNPKRLKLIADDMGVTVTDLLESEEK